MLLGAGDGTAAVVLVEHGVQKAKELQVIGQLSWLHMCAVICFAKPLFVIYLIYILLYFVAGTCCTDMTRPRFCRLFGKVRYFCCVVRLDNSCSSASIDAARSWRGGGLLQPLRVSPCAAEAMTAAQGKLNLCHIL
jgi:hypothetical protein